jgi:HAMP domain-containing protein
MIGAGNLDYTVDTMAKDEVGQLSSAFDRMSIQ